MSQSLASFAFKNVTGLVTDASTSHMCQPGPPPCHTVGLGTRKTNANMKFMLPAVARVIKSLSQTQELAIICQLCNCNRLTSQSASG